MNHKHKVEGKKVEVVCLI